MVRAFTLLEITISVVVVGVVSAVAVPNVQAAIRVKRQDAIGEKAKSMVGAARDVARTELRCVTVAPIEPCNGEIGLTTWTHKCAAGGDPSFDDQNGNLIPDDQADAPPPVLIEKFAMDTALVRSVEMLEPDEGCSGGGTSASPPRSCYGRTSWFQYRENGTTTKPFLLRVTAVDGTVKEFVIAPGSGSIRTAG